MSQTKQAAGVAHLKGANYYGSTIPPPQPYQSQPNGRSCALTTLMMKVIIGFAIGFTIPILIFYLAASPIDIKFKVVTASLTQFDLNNTNNNSNIANTLNYNLSLSMDARNPNKKIGIYYEMLHATASYKGERFSWVSLSSFYQGHKNTTNLRLNFRGQSVIVLVGSDLSEFNSEKKTGVYYIDVKLYGQIRCKLGSIKTRRVKPEIECNLKIPLGSNNGTLARGFESTTCDVYY